MPIDTRLNYEDILWLIAAADAWEEKESHEFYQAKEILSIPEFEEDHPAYDFIQALKRKYRGKEQQLADIKDGVSEKASTMKAKLYFLKKQLGMAGLLDVEEQAIVDGDGNVTRQEEPKKPHPLEAELKQAIRDEDYNKAAQLRDKLKAIKKSEKSENSDE